MQGIENTPMLARYWLITSNQSILSDVRTSERGHEHFDRQNLKLQVKIFFITNPLYNYYFLNKVKLQLCSFSIKDEGIKSEPKVRKIKLARIGF